MPHRDKPSSRFGLPACFSPALALASASLFLTACGSTYRPVVSAINPVGPAGQPTKYAVAISTTGATTPGVVTIVDVSGDSVLVTAKIGANPQYLTLAPGGSTGYTLNGDGTVNSFGVSTGLISSQVNETTLPLGANPSTLISEGGSIYITEPGRDSVAQLTGTPPSLKLELPTGPNSVYTVTVNGAPRSYVVVQGSAGAPGHVAPIETPTQTLDSPIPVGVTPVYGVMTADARRAFIMNAGSNSVTVINVQTNTLDSFSFPANISSFAINSNVVTFNAPNQFTAGETVTIAGLTTGSYLDGQTLTVLPTGLSSSQFQAAFAHANVATTNDAGTATGLASTIPVGTAPIWADFAPSLNQMLVVNQGNSATCTAAGGATCPSVSVVSIPLCSASTVVTNPNCNVNNPVDAIGFGSVVATIPLVDVTGKPVVNPVQIAVLQDGTQAYVASAGNAAAGINGSINVIDLTTDTVVATLPAAVSTDPTDNLVHGHPGYISVTTGLPTGKVYITAPDSGDMTVLRTDTNTIQTHIPLQSNGVMVHVNTP